MWLGESDNVMRRGHICADKWVYTELVWLLFSSQRNGMKRSPSASRSPCKTSRLREVTWLFDVCRLAVQHSADIIIHRHGSEEKLFSGRKSFWGRPCALESDTKFMTEWQSGSHFLPRGLFAAEVFLGGMSRLILLEFIFNRFLGGNTSIYTCIHLHSVFFKCLSLAMNNVQFIHQRSAQICSWPSSLCFGICIYIFVFFFSFKSSTGNAAPISRRQKQDIGCGKILS